MKEWTFDRHYRASGSTPRNPTPDDRPKVDQFLRVADEAGIAPATVFRPQPISNRVPRLCRSSSMAERRGHAPQPFRESICLANSPGTLVRLTLHEMAPEAGLAPAPQRLTGERATLTPLWNANWRRGWESRPRRFLGRTWLPTRVLVYAGPPPKYLVGKEVIWGAS